MRKPVLIALSVVVTAALLSTPLLSATIDDLVGTWETCNIAKIKISRIGSRSSENYSTTTLNANGTFNLLEIDSTGSYNYTGTWSLIKEGKKLSVGLDSAGRAELERVWENWLIEVAREYGASIENISFSVASSSISQPSIPKKTNIPKTATIKAKGWVSATVNSEYMTKRFSYTGKVYFLSRH